MMNPYQSPQSESYSNSTLDALDWWYLFGAASSPLLFGPLALINTAILLWIVFYVRKDQ